MPIFLFDKKLAIKLPKKNKHETKPLAKFVPIWNTKTIKINIANTLKFTTKCNAKQ